MQLRISGEHRLDFRRLPGPVSFFRTAAGNRAYGEQSCALFHAYGTELEKFKILGPWCDFNIATSRNAFIIFMSFQRKFNVRLRLKKPFL